MDLATAPLSTVQPGLDTQGYTPAQAARLAKAQEAARKFEAAFIYQFMELSSPPMDKNSPMNGGFGEEMFRHSLNEQAANAIAQKGGFGLADHILSQMAQRGDIPPLPKANAIRAYQQAPQATVTETTP